MLLIQTIFFDWLDWRILLFVVNFLAEIIKTIICPTKTDLHYLLSVIAFTENKIIMKFELIFFFI